MIPKEKAEELYNMILYTFQGYIDEYTAKKCALISIDEIITLLKNRKNNSSEDDEWKVNLKLLFMEYVKEELEKL